MPRSFSSFSFHEDDALLLATCDCRCLLVACEWGRVDRHRRLPLPGDDEFPLPSLSTQFLRNINPACGVASTCPPLALSSRRDRRPPICRTFPLPALPVLPLPSGLLHAWLFTFAAAIPEISCSAARCTRPTCFDHASVSPRHPDGEDSIDRWIDDALMNGVGRANNNSTIGEEGVVRRRCSAVKEEGLDEMDVSERSY